MMAAHGRISFRTWVRTALALAVAGLLTLLGGGVMLAVGAPATGDPDQAAGSPLAVEDECVPAEAWTGYWTGSGESADPADAAWVLESPGAGWYVDGERSVEDQAAVLEGPTDWLTAPPDGREWVVVETRVIDGAVISPDVDQWWHWNPGDAGGVQDPADPPPVAGWNADNGNHNGIEAPLNTPYNTSNETSGNSSWFFHEVRDAEYEQVTQYRYTLDVPAVTHSEYLFAFEHEAVTCEEPTEEPTETNEPPEVLPTEATAPNEPTGQPGGQPGDRPAAEVEVAGVEASAPSVPTAVDAGVGGAEQGRSVVQLWGTALMVGGTALLLAAGGVLAGARTRETA